MKEKLDQLIQKTTQGKFAEDILTARKDYQKTAGEIYEDDKSYESRVGMFLEWFIFDRLDPETRLTPLETLIRDNGSEGLPKELNNIQEIATNIHGLFVIKKIRYKEVVVLNLFDDKKYTVRESEGSILFQKNELVEARIILNNKEYHFSGNFCFHPKEALKFIKGEVKKISSLREGYLKDLKKINSELKDATSKLDKNAREIEKFNSKIDKSKSEEKSKVWSEQLKGLKIIRTELMSRASDIELLKTNMETEKLKNEINQLSNELIQRLNYMNLKWERSRQIDLQDIYRN